MLQWSGDPDGQRLSTQPIHPELRWAQIRPLPVKNHSAFAAPDQCIRAKRSRFGKTCTTPSADAADGARSWFHLLTVVARASGTIFRLRQYAPHLHRGRPSGGPSSARVSASGIDMPCITQAARSEHRRQKCISQSLPPEASENVFHVRWPWGAPISQKRRSPPRIAVDHPSLNLLSTSGTPDFFLSSGDHCQPVGWETAPASDANPGIVVANSSGRHGVRIRFGNFRHWIL